MGARGNAAADLLLSRRGQPPSPPKLTLVATADGPVCGRCRQPAARLVSAYWGRDLCPTCCAEVVAGFDRAGSWPAPIDQAAAVRPVEPVGSAAPCPPEPLEGLPTQDHPSRPPEIAQGDLSGATP
jgi:hypothetical protein